MCQSAAVILSAVNTHRKEKNQHEINHKKERVHKRGDVSSGILLSQTDAHVGSSSVPAGVRESERGLAGM